MSKIVSEEQIGLGSTPANSSHSAELHRLIAETAAFIERWIDMLDRVEGDPDFEPDVDAEEGADDEPSLGAPEQLREPTRLVHRRMG